VVPLKTRQVPPLELQTPSIARPAGERFEGYESGGRRYVAVRRAAGKILQLFIWS
jgi:hypothetical protein